LIERPQAGEGNSLRATTRTGGNERVRRRRCSRLLPSALAALLSLALLASSAQPALGHAMDVYAHVSVDEQGTVVARMVDVYGGLVEGQRVELYARPQGGRAGAPVVMEEVGPGIYRGRAVPDRPGPYEAVIDLALGGDVHRVTLQVEPGVPVPEQYLLTEQVEPLPWTRILFAAAAVVLVVGSVIAWRRRPAGPEPEMAGGGMAQ